jgi:hypothetical protein
VSTTIEVAIRAAPPYAAALATLGPDVRCLEAEPDGAAWPDGIRHLYRDQISTRTTEVTCSAGQFAIRCFSLAAREDIALALALAQHVAAHAGVATVDAEGFGAVAPGELGAVYDAAWCDAQVESGLRVLAALIADGRGPMQVPGPRRSFYIGERVLAELAGDPSALLAAIRRVQWHPAHTAGSFVARAKTDGREITLATWLGDEQIVFPGVEYALLRDGESVFLIPAAQVPVLAGARWHPLDERQGVIDAFGAAWPALVAAARTYETTA